MSDEQQPEPSRVVAVIGSPRENGNTESIVDVVLAELADRGAKCSKLRIADYSISPCAGHEDCLPRCPQAEGDDSDAVLDTIYEADAVILAAPSFYGNVPGPMKALFDRTCHHHNNGPDFEPQVVGLVAVAAAVGLQETADAMRRFVEISSERPIPTFELCGIADRLGDALADDDLVDGARQLALQLAGQLDLA